MPPPTTIIMKIPDADAVYLPKPSVARLKILAHITLVHKPQSTNNKALIGTVTMSKLLPVKTGIDTVMLLPRTIATMINPIAIVVVIIINVRLETLSAMNPVLKRPTNIKNQ